GQTERTLGVAGRQEIAYRSVCDARLRLASLEPLTTEAHGLDACVLLTPLAGRGTRKLDVPDSSTRSADQKRPANPGWVKQNMARDRLAAIRAAQNGPANQFSRDYQDEYDYGERSYPAQTRQASSRSRQPAEEAHYRRESYYEEPSPRRPTHNRRESGSYQASGNFSRPSRIASLAPQPADYARARQDDEEDLYRQHPRGNESTYARGMQPVSSNSRRQDERYRSEERSRQAERGRPSYERYDTGATDDSENAEDARGRPAQGYSARSNSQKQSRRAPENVMPETARQPERGLLAPQSAYRGAQRQSSMRSEAMSYASGSADSYTLASGNKSTATLPDAPSLPYNGSARAQGPETKPLQIVKMSPLEARALEAAYGSMETFFNELTEIDGMNQTLAELVDQVENLHARQLDSTGLDAQSEAVTRDVDRTQIQIRALNAKTSAKIKILEARNARPVNVAQNDIDTRRTQTARIKDKFIQTVQRYQQVELVHRQQSKNRLARQYKTVNPDLSDQEVQAAVRDAFEGGEGQQIFAQAFRNTNRVGAVRSAAAAVEQRHQDIQRIEKTLTELAQLFNDMATLIEQQDVQIVQIEQQAEFASKEVETAQQELVKGKVSAKGARSKRKCCAGIFAAIILVVIVVVVIYVLKIRGSNDNNSSNNQNRAVTATTADPAQVVTDASGETASNPLPGITLTPLTSTAEADPGTVATASADPGVATVTVTEGAASTQMARLRRRARSIEDVD
ncbi:uncharacterized protein L969DRAFT_50175, partial [Mixia osmundae IAM 14324]